MVKFMQPFIGEIRLFPYSFAPAGWAFCQGQLLPIDQNENLFQLIGTKFGGNGTTNFALPNLQGAEPVPGTNYCISLFGIFPAPN